VTLPTRNYASMDAYLDAVSDRVIAASEGSLGTSVTGRLVCVAYVHPSGSATLDQTRRKNTSGTTVTRANSDCFSDGQASSETRIQVMAERSVTFEAGLWSRSITLHQQLVFKYEVTSGL
jgi:hypothetical protein